MAYGDIKRLSTQGQQLAASAGVIYTAPSAKRSQLGSVILHNTSASSRDIRLYINGTTSTARILFVTLSANETFELSPKVPLVLEGSQTFQGEASVASEVNIFVFGREET